MLNLVSDLEYLIYKELSRYYDKDNRLYPTFNTAAWHLANGVEVNQGMINAARGGHISLVKFFIEKGASDWNHSMYRAASGGHLELVKFFIEKGANDWNYNMYGAARRGHINLVQFFISKGANDWNGGMYRAALGSHIELVKFFIQKGANNFQDCYNITSNEDIKHLLKDKI